MIDSQQLITTSLQSLGVDLVPGTASEIESLESKLLELPPLKCIQRSHFGPGVWVRELRAPAGSLLIGHEHIHANLNILAYGEKIMVIGDKVERMIAPYCVLSGPGVRKIGLTLTDMCWYSVHANPTDEQDEEKLEAMFYRKSGAFLSHEIRKAEEKLLRLKASVPGFLKQEDHTS